MAALIYFTGLPLAAGLIGGNVVAGWTLLFCIAVYTALLFGPD